ncbi:DUF3169 family protein [Metabacillus sp. Hm71]|uniref:DUF3169 family protein n=1 Tax=Metabacillus sp. Hm71 TaxID=3450743 RepID=UPI003F439636
MKKVWIQLIISGAVGFIVAILLLNYFTFDFSNYADTIVISILVMIFILLGLSVFLYRQIKKLNHTQFTGDEEDEADVLMYKKFMDYSFFVQVSNTLSILALCITVITSQKLVFTIIAVVTLILSYILTALMTSLMQLVYPERNLPSISEPNYSEKLLDISDEGEKHVMLIGLYKAYQLLSVALIFAIVLSTLYSLSTGNSQLFSIIIMSIVLLLVNGKYCLSVRNK